MNTLTKSYAEISPAAAWKLLSDNPDSILVDVRTDAEWYFVGEPDLSQISKKNIRLSWRIYPTMEINKQFEEKLSGIVSNKDIAIAFLCKTGGRSGEAAAEMTKKRYTNCYNISGGFEGDADSFAHRGTLNGWKASNLPWRQS